MWDKIHLTTKIPLLPSTRYPAQYHTTERYIAYLDWLARSDYIVFRIDYRGHDRSEGEASGAYGHPGYTAKGIF